MHVWDENIVFGVARAVCVYICDNNILVVVLWAINSRFLCVGVDVWMHFSANSERVESLEV